MNLIIDDATEVFIGKSTGKPSRSLGAWGVLPLSIHFSTPSVLKIWR